MRGLPADRGTLLEDAGIGDLVEDLGCRLQAGSLLRIDIEAQRLGELAAEAGAQDVGAGVGLGEFTGCGDGRLRCSLDSCGRCQECALEDPRFRAVAYTCSWWDLFHCDRFRRGAQQ